jgi:hypothetical protein
VANGPKTSSPDVSLSPESPSQTEILINRFEERERQFLADWLSALDTNSRVLMTVAGVFAIFLGLGAWKRWRTRDDRPPKTSKCK